MGIVIAGYPVSAQDNINSTVASGYVRVTGVWQTDDTITNIAYPYSFSSSIYPTQVYDRDRVPGGSYASADQDVWHDFEGLIDINDDPQDPNWLTVDYVYAAIRD